jgi:hypothetical protein
MKIKIHHTILLSLLTLHLSTAPLSSAKQVPPPFASTGSYSRKIIQGWTVLFSRELMSQHPSEALRVEKHLNQKLAAHAQVLPARALSRLRRVNIWIEWNDPKYPGGVYHPGREWLQENGYNPEMAGGIELGNARNFLSWTQDADQPMMVLHELAHAYHDQVLGFDHQGILQAYHKAKKSGKYNKVQRHSGPIGPAYALTDDQEYFAESSEAFFGTNDFFPFVRSELKAVDPIMENLLKKLWAAP